MKRKCATGSVILSMLMAAGLPAPGPARAVGGPTSAASSTIFAGLINGAAYRSTTGTSDWRLAHQFPLEWYLSALATVPDGRTIYAGISYGIAVSKDGGQTWKSDNGGSIALGKSWIIGLAVPAENALEVEALSWQGQLWVRTSAGSQWQVRPLPPWTAKHLVSFAMSPSNPDVVLAGTQDGRVVVSTDGGNRWDAATVVSGTPISALAFDPRSSAVAYAATNTGIYQTVDGGITWQHDQRGIPASEHTISEIVVDPSNPARVISAGLDGAFYRSEDGGRTWSYQGQTANNEVYALVFDPAHPGVVLAGTKDASVIYRSEDSGGHWSMQHTNLGSDNAVDVLAVLVHRRVPTDPVPTPSGNVGGVRFFPQSHHTVSGAFLSFYNANNGLKIFGLPLTESFVDGGKTAQYFERSELVLTRGQLSIMPLGTQLTAGRRFRPLVCCPPGNEAWFPQTQHSLVGNFLAFWRTHNGPLLFGLPISQPLRDTNDDGTGRTYLVQYFQNARMEYHPELAGTGNVVTLGLLGKEALQRRGWL